MSLSIPASPVRGFSVAWPWVKPGAITVFLVRSREWGITNNTNPIGLYFGHVSGNVSFTAYDYDAAIAVNITNVPVTVSDTWLLLGISYAPGTATLYGNVDGSGNPVPYMPKLTHYGSGATSGAGAADPISTWAQTGYGGGAGGKKTGGGAWTPNGTFNTAGSGNWVGPSSAVSFRGAFGGFWLWFDRVLSGPEWELFYQAPWAMLQDTSRLAWMPVGVVPWKTSLAEAATFSDLRTLSPGHAPIETLSLGDGRGMGGNRAPFAEPCSLTDMRSNQTARAPIPETVPLSDQRSVNAQPAPNEAVTLSDQRSANVNAARADGFGLTDNRTVNAGHSDAGEYSALGPAGKRVQRGARRGVCAYRHPRRSDFPDGARGVRPHASFLCDVNSRRAVTGVCRYAYPK